MIGNEFGSINLLEEVKNYETDNVFCAYLGDAIPDELEEIIGKKVKEIVNDEYSLRIIFNDDSYIECNGARWGDSSLGVEVKLNNE